jgi:peptidoglycan/xylan/chitin deacetylase (PgdA/CDA1 family)
MGWIREWFDVLPLEDAVAALSRGSLPARALAITFDDGYADNFTVALPILRELGLPATFFVASGFLDGGRMWNDTVIEGVRGCPGPVLELTALGLGSYPVTTVEARRAAIAALVPRLKHLDPAERQRLADGIAERAGGNLPDDLMMTARQLRELAAAGMSIGAHTVHHPILARLPETEARTEIVEGRQRLAAICGVPVNLFAYPNGKPGTDYGAEHVRLARAAGFKAAVSTAWGAAGVGSDLFQIPRFTPWDRSALRYGLRLAGNLRRRGYATAGGGR